MKNKYSFKTIITKKDLKNFAKLSGDNNKIHINKKYAIKKGFEGNVVHGALIISLFSKLIGNKLPGNGALILFSEYKFHNQAYLNLSITIGGKISSVSKSTSTISLNLYAKYAKSGKIISTGNSIVRFK